MFTVTVFVLLLVLLFEQTGRSPIVIPVVNVVGGGKPSNGDQNGNGRPNAKPQAGQPAQPEQPTPEEQAAQQQRHFQELRAKLLGQDQHT